MTAVAAITEPFCEKASPKTTITQNRWACPKCLILDVHDIVMQYDPEAYRTAPHTKCRHCGYTRRRPVSIGTNGSNGRFKRGPHKPLVKCPKCGNLGTVGNWHGLRATFIYHCGVSKGNRLHYVSFGQRAFVLEQLKQ